MNKLLVSPSPHWHAAVSTKSLMLDVVIALLPAVAVSVFFYGWMELLVLAVSVVSCVLLEYLITRYLLKRPSTIGDMSAVVTGILLALNLPPTIPLWIVFIGALVAIGVAKMTFGGIGQNVFNPALTGRVFLLVSFPTFMTHWEIPTGYFGAGLGTDAATGATPLGVIKRGPYARFHCDRFDVQSWLLL
jgi:electron transport complex protein RnfD